MIGLVTSLADGTPLARVTQDASDDHGLIEIALPIGFDPQKSWVVQGEALVPNLAPIKAAALAKIDREAEAFCASFVTPGDTQMMRYKRKEEQARAWLADNDAPVPMLEAEAAGTGTTVAALVSVVIGLADQWNAIMDAVEAARLSAKTAASAATTPAAVETAAAVDWAGLLE